MAAAKKAPAKPAKTAKTSAPKPPKAPKEPKQKIERATANGITKPKDGSQTGKVWDIADAISAKKKAPADRAEVMEQAVAAGVNEATVATQYQRWRTFNGVQRTPAAPKAPKAPKAPGKGKSAAAE